MSYRKELPRDAAPSVDSTAIEAARKESPYIPSSMMVILLQDVSPKATFGDERTFRFTFDRGVREAAMQGI
ncbi:hypothetical protein FisN_15Hu351 [Fistulifera solaris]|uniref:Uncharacterized protein n=1 Tax=Fistulifera solaris TaxID=1519565 RepID=A0A1Z5JG11_FISSO|nr:hypothetical protein FisN_15Hu351 [Fistulifera solaris]|eukprot:GAX12866.1 hypothetical protein FisN_15Hu351 [Fistulifera solaris]